MVLCSEPLNRGPTFPGLFRSGLNISDLVSVCSVLCAIKNTSNRVQLLRGQSPLYVQCTIGPGIPATAMIDSGASMQFISPSFCLKHSLTTTILEEPQDLTLFDGTHAKDGQLTHFSDLKCNIGNHQEELAMYVTTLQPDVDIVLGKSWLGYHNPAINWGKNIVTFSSETCHEECLRQGSTTA